MSRDDSWTISELADQLDISARSIRFYEEKGLISPQRTPGGHRVYTRRDRARMRLILRGKRFGYSLDEIAEMIGMADVDMDEADQIRKSLEYGEKKLRELAQRKEEISAMEADLEAVRQKMLERLKQLEGTGKQ
ncbi:MAG TPA: MerR family DNA-binding transcriptional regulator [Desulfobacteraceae bacterium]|nr:MerR family DNA-binding transcriptional regulator [Deltaproteobacteria bacterium]MBW2356141.1 MerR family DNA-binding transcriptional regulator [Deltaproteobacteria bacterium]HDI60868.1 MerR family DNA-binding transcriptional regulator [Desulfobacteraceae bacterium]